MIRSFGQPGYTALRKTLGNKGGDEVVFTSDCTQVINMST